MSSFDGLNYASGKRMVLWRQVLFFWMILVLSGVLEASAHETHETIDSNLSALNSTDIEAIEAVVSEAPESLEVRISKSIFLIENPKEKALRSSFDSLPGLEQQSFLQKRKSFLRFAARSLHLIKYGLVAIQKLRSRASESLQSLRDQRMAEQMLLQSESVREDFIASREQSNKVTAQIRALESAKSIRAQADEQVLSRLQSLDRILWQQARLVSGCNEAGFGMALGVQLLGGSSSSGWGGLWDLGFTIGGSLNDKAIVLQIFREKESYRSSTMPAVFVGGIVGKIGGFVAHHKSGELSHSGTSFYPPMAPAFSSSTESEFFGGASTGLTWPPSPVGDMLTYTNSLERRVMLRLSASPKMKGFIRVESALSSNQIRQLFKLQTIQPMTCSRVF